MDVTKIVSIAYSWWNGIIFPKKNFFFSKTNFFFPVDLNVRLKIVVRTRSSNEGNIVTWKYLKLRKRDTASEHDKLYPGNSYFKRSFESNLCFNLTFLAAVS